MIHITVGIAQFFVILLTQMAIVVFGVVGIGLGACVATYVACRILLRRRRA